MAAVEESPAHRPACGRQTHGRSRARVGSLYAGLRSFSHAGEQGALQPVRAGYQRAAGASAGGTGMATRRRGGRASRQESCGPVQSTLASWHSPDAVYRRSRSLISGLKRRLACPAGVVGSPFPEDVIRDPLWERGTDDLAGRLVKRSIASAPDAHRTASCHGTSGPPRNW